MRGSCNHADTGSRVAAPAQVSAAGTAMNRRWHKMAAAAVGSRIDWHLCFIISGHMQRRSAPEGRWALAGPSVSRPSRLASTKLCHIRRLAVLQIPSHGFFISLSFHFPGAALSLLLGEAVPPTGLFGASTETTSILSGGTFHCSASRRSTLHVEL